MNAFTDGSCLVNPGVGGWCYCVVFDQIDKPSYMTYHAGAEESTTNNRMELTAILKCLEYLKELPCQDFTFKIWSDSKYCVDGVNQWMYNWAKSNWKVDKKNLDLWKQLYKEWFSFPVKIEIGWIKAHNGHVFNHFVDMMARSKAEELKK